MARTPRNRIERHREILAQVIWPSPRGDNSNHWSNQLNEEIWLSSPEEIKKFLDGLAKASMRLADEELIEAEVKWRSTPKSKEDYSGDSGATKL